MDKGGLGAGLGVFSSVQWRSRRTHYAVQIPGESHTRVVAVYDRIHFCINIFFTPVVLIGFVSGCDSPKYRLVSVNPSLWTPELCKLYSKFCFSAQETWTALKALWLCDPLLL